MREWGLRAKAWVDQHFDVVVAVLLFLVLLGGYLTYTAYLDQETTVETRTTGTWESVGDFSHSATVIEDTDPFAEGTVLRNRSVYFRHVTPVLEGSFVYGYTASQGGDLTTRVTVDLVIRSVAGDVGFGDASSQSGEGANELWRVERTLGKARDRSLEPGEQLTVPFSTNVSAAEVRAQEIEEQLDATSGETQVLIVATVDLSGTRNGEEVDRTRTYRLPISVESDIYRVSDPGRVTNAGNHKERVTVPVSASIWRWFGGPLLVVLGIVALAGLVVARDLGDLDVPADQREWLAYKSARDEYDDWITTARLPDDVFDGPIVIVVSLEGLVDIAIDTNQRVIEDPIRNQYVVDAGRFRYVYAPPSSHEAVASESDPLG